MLRIAIAIVLAAAATVAAAANTETRAEQSQTQARGVLDRAVEANGGAEALREIEVVRLHLEGQTFPRLQMTTPAPPFEGGSFDETLLIDLEKNRMRLDQKASGFGFDADNTVTIADGSGGTYDNRARTVSLSPSSAFSTTGDCRTSCCGRRSIARTRCATSGRTSSTEGVTRSSPSSCRTRSRSLSTWTPRPASSRSTSCC